MSDQASTDEPFTLPSPLTNLLLPLLCKSSLPTNLAAVSGQALSGPASATVTAALTARLAALHQENEEMYELLKRGAVGRLHEEVRELRVTARKLEGALQGMRSPPSFFWNGLSVSQTCPCLSFGLAFPFVVFRVFPSFHFGHFPSPSPSPWPLLPLYGTASMDTLLITYHSTVTFFSRVTHDHLTAQVCINTSYPQPGDLHTHHTLSALCSSGLNWRRLTELSNDMGKAPDPVGNRAPAPR